MTIGEIRPHDAIRQYAAFGADIDLFAVKGRNARNIFIVTAGTGLLTITDEHGDEVALTGLEDGTYVEPSPTWFGSIIAGAGTTVTLIRVGW